MKTHKLLMLIASVGLIFGMMTGCGGGSDGGSDGGSSTPGSTPDTGLKPDKVNDFIGNMAEELGCEYTEITQSQNIEEDIAISFSTFGLVKKVIVSGKNLKSLADAPIIADAQEGSCGGSVTLPDSGLVGDIVFDNYCEQDDATGAQATLDGSLRIAMNEEEGTLVASTPQALTITSSNPENDSPLNLTIDLDSATLTIRDDGSMNLKLTRMVITDNITKKVYTISNVNGDIDAEGERITFSGTLDNPEVTGAVDVVADINSATGNGVITVTDQDGMVVKLNTTQTEGVFDVSFDGAQIGEMDCSMITAPEIPLL